MGESGPNYEKIPKSTAFLLKYIDVVHTVGQKILPKFKNFVFETSYQSKNWARSSPNKVIPIELEYGIRAHEIQLSAVLKKWGYYPFLHVRSNDLGILDFRLSP